MSTTDPIRDRATFETALADFQQAFSEKPAWFSRAPGRVNLLGGHVDYNEGLVLPVAIDLEVVVGYRTRGDRRVRVHSAEFDETAEFDLDELTPGSVGGWAAYPAGVAWALKKKGFELRGLDAAATSAIPIGAGLSSSAALEVAFAAAFRQAGGLDLANLELARVCQVAENDFVGVRCGIMDQVASACAETRKAILLDCRSLELRLLTVPPNLRIVVFDTAGDRALASSEYNARRSECESAVASLRGIGEDIQALRDVAPDQLDHLIRHLPAPVDRRVRHVVGEIERVRLAAAALEGGETERMGELMFASHRSLRDDYQVSTEELDTLVSLAQRAPGAVGARLTGAGFGGCTVNLVSAALTLDFVDAVSEGYTKLFGRIPQSFISEPAPGASVQKAGW